MCGFLQDDGWVDLFLPAYQTQTRMYLRDSKGVVRPILQDGPLTLAQVRLAMLSLQHALQLYCISAHPM